MIGNDLRPITVQEYGTLSGLPLSPLQVRELQSLAPKIELRPSLHGGFDLTATSWIGTLRVDGLPFTIRPKIPISRVLFLFSYSLDPRAWRDTSFDYETEQSLVEAMAPGFIALTRRALTRGLLRGYRERHAALQTVRGRLRFCDQIRRRYGRFPPAELTYDEFTEDVPENRVLLAAIQRLGRLRIRSEPVLRDLRRLRGRFQGVTLIDYSGRPPPTITFDRLNEHYRPALLLARLILGNSSITQRAGGVTSLSFLVNMDSVFENFVVVALRDALGLSARAFPQQAKGRRLWLDQGRRVRLKPDISQWSAGRPIFVGDVKYKDLDRGGVRNDDLYQVLGYLEGTGLQEGMLIYAGRNDESREFRMLQSGKRIRVEGWGLERSEEELLDRVRETARRIRRISADREDDDTRVSG